MHKLDQYATENTLVIENTLIIADTLVEMGIYENIDIFLLCLKTSQSQNILNTAYQLNSLKKVPESLHWLQNVPLKSYLP